VKRPAAGCRRPLFFVLGALLVSTGCQQQGPSADPVALRRVVATAIARLQADHPTWTFELELSLRLAEGVTAAERESPFWRRNPDRVDRAWLELVERASTYVIRQKAERTGLAASWQSALAEAESAVREAKSYLVQPGMGREEARAHRLAAARLAVARGLARRGDLEGAILSASQARLAAARPGASWAKQQERFSDPSLLRRWRSMVEETLSESRRNGGSAIVVDKLSRRLVLYRSGRVHSVHQAELGVNGLRPKQYAGDRATPEGRYKVTAKKRRPQTKFYLALLINYPNQDDRSRFRAASAAGLMPRGVGIGSLIEIHGEGGNGRDWTDGCVALDNGDMDIVFNRVDVGTPVTIVGTF